MQHNNRIERKNDKIIAINITQENGTIQVGLAPLTATMPI